MYGQPRTVEAVPGGYQPSLSQAAVSPHHAEDVRTGDPLPYGGLEEPSGQ